MEPYRGSLGFNMRVATAALNRRLKRVLAQKGLNLSEYTVLRTLGDQDGMSLFEISKTSRRSPTQLTGGVRTLKRKGLVRGVVSSSDKRVSHIYLTEAGKDILMQLGELRDRVVGNMGLTPSEIETLRRLTGKIIETDDQS